MYMEKKQIAVWALRLGLAFAFLYPAISSLITPSDWIGFVPRAMRELFGGDQFLTVFSIIEILIGAGVLFMRRPLISLYAAIGVLAVVVYFNLGAFDLVFRDISIIAMAIALAVLTAKHT